MSAQSNGMQRLIDIEEIRQLKARFGRLADALCQDTAPAVALEFGSLFTEGATLDSAAFGHYEGREQIQALFAQAVPSQMRGMWHAFFNPEIEVNGDHASAHWAMLAYTQAANASSPDPVLTIGRYRDEYTRVAGQWKLSKLYFETVLADADALKSAGAGTRDAMVNQARG